MRLPYIRYGSRLTQLWYEFLAGLPQKFARQKPLRSYVADFYCAQQLLVIELDGDSHYAAGAAGYDGRRTTMKTFESVCREILAALDKT